jgi:hypothetical protein
MEYRPPSEADSRSGGEEILRPFTESEGPLPCPQEPDNGPYPKPPKPSTHTSTPYCVKAHFNIILPPKHRS